MKKIKQITFWNQRTYGNAVIVNVPKKYKIPLSIICLITPATNWLIPFIWVGKLVWRY